MQEPSAETTLKYAGTFYSTKLPRISVNTIAKWLVFNTLPFLTIRKAGVESY